MPLVGAFKHANKWTRGRGGDHHGSDAKIDGRSRRRWCRCMVHGVTRFGNFCYFGKISQ